jgi:hypothetical protein
MLFTFSDGRLARFEWSTDPEGLLGSLPEGDSGESRYAGRGSPTQ